MLNVLIVEDSPEKLADILDVVTDILGVNARIESANCLYELRQYLSRFAFDIVILDLNIPRFANEVAEPGIGASIFDWFSTTAADVQRPGYLVGLTGFLEIEKEFSVRFADEGFALLQYSASTQRWRSQLSKVLAHATAVASQTLSAFRFDLGIVTALSHVEFEALLRLESGWKRMEVEGDPTLYFEGRFSEGEKKVTVVAAAAAKMGMPACTALAMQMIHSCRPRHLAMVGIAAGIRGNYGDILIAEQAFDYGSGKRRRAEDGTQIFEPAPEAIPIDRGLRARLAEFRTRRDVLQRIFDGWAGNKPKELTARIGAIGSGAAVLEDREIVSVLQSNQRKLIGIEMEIYGLFEAASVCSSPAPSVFAVKSICDFADKDKNDEFQEYAAYTSAEFVRQFALEYLARKVA